MRKIALTQIQKIGRYYTVFLDRGSTFRFTNKRKAEDFLCKVNKRLNEGYLFISDEYLLIEGIYREMYQYISNYENLFRLKNSLDFLRNRLEAIPVHPETENKNYFIVTFIETSLLELLSVYRDMKEEKWISRRNTALMHRLDLRCRILSLYCKEFRDFQRELKVESKIEIKYNNNLKVV